MASDGYAKPAAVGFDSVRSRIGVPAARFSSKSWLSRLGGRSQWSREENNGAGKQTTYHAATVMRLIRGHIAVGLRAGAAAAMTRAGAVMVAVAMRSMTGTAMAPAVFASARAAIGQRCRAQNKGAGEEKREISFHALECGMRGENRRR